VTHLFGVSAPLATELCEAVDIKTIKFMNYRENSILAEVEVLLRSVIPLGLFPYDPASFPFDFMPSDSVSSLFTSPYITGIERTIAFAKNMN
jgi:hypothetical protein